MSEPKWMSGDDDDTVCKRCDQRHDDDCVPEDYDTMDDLLGD